MCEHKPTCVTREEHLRKLHVDMQSAPEYYEYEDSITRDDYSFVIRFEQDQLNKTNGDRYEPINQSD